MAILDTNDTNDTALNQGGMLPAPLPQRADEKPVSSFAAARQAVRAKVTNAADIMQFSTDALRSLPKVRMYLSEVFRQTGVLIFSSGVVIWFMMLLMGLIFASVGSTVVGELGAQGVVGIYPAFGGLRFTGPEMWGWILSAKVGCGIVAEFGSMRISDEIDALEVMGISAKPYLVGTRLVATFIAMPFLYIVGLGLLYLSSTILLVDVMHTVSSGGYFQVLWTFQQATDLIYSLVWALILGTVITLVGCYYGFTVKGGPVGVGRNAAKSMVVNLVAVSVIGMICEQLFWGGSPNLPIGN